MPRDFVEKQVVTSSPKHARKLIAGSNQGGSAAGNEGLKIFEGARIMADVRVAVDKAWRDVGACTFYDLGTRAAIAFGARADIANPAVEYGYFDAGKNFAGIDVDQFAAGDNEIGFNLTQCAADQSSQFFLSSGHGSLCGTKALRLPGCTTDADLIPFENWHHGIMTAILIATLMNSIVGARKIFLIAVLNAGCIVCDQATKWVAKQYLGPGDLISFAGDLFRLQYAENTGAFLSLGASLPDAWRQFAFTTLVGLFLVALLLYTIFSATLAPRHIFSLSLLCGGGLSNLMDRIAYGGRVVDFLNVGIGPLRTGIFNVADMAITAAAILLAVDALRQPTTKAALPESRKIDG